ncbi:MAG: LysE family translocator [Bauldia sp.]
MPDFVPEWPVLLAYSGAAIVLAWTPGPDMTFFLSKTVSQSRAAGLAAFFGAWVGVVIHAFLVAAGLSALLLASATAFTVLKVAGAIYLAYLAYDAIRNGSSLSLKEGAAPERLPSVFVKGLLIDLLNPKIIVFNLTFLPQFVAANDANAPGKLLFLGLTFAVIAIPTCLPLIFFAERIAGRLRNSRRLTRTIDWVFASVLSMFALRLALTEGR